MGLSCSACFDGGNRQQRQEEDRLDSAKARAKAVEAAQKRREEFEKSAAGRAASAAQNKMVNEARDSNPGKPVLKWQMG